MGSRLGSGHLDEWAVVIERSLLVSCEDASTPCRPLVPDDRMSPGLKPFLMSDIRING